MCMRRRKPEMKRADQKAKPRRPLGGDSIEKFQLEIWLEKSL